MKKLFLTTVALAAAFTLTAAEGDKKKGERPPMTDEQKAIMKEIKEKYDANKDGKLDAEEKAKISEEDKAKMKKAGLGGGPKKEKKN